MPLLEADKPDTEPAIADEDRDSLHILPLATVVIETTALRRARLIKNARLDSVVEMFEDRKTGSGQIDISEVARVFGLTLSPPHEDVVLLQKLADLPSFDVYSLRILFRDNGIPIASASSLSLSQAKTRELASYMTKFTRPLIKEIYQSDDVQADTLDDILGLFRDPNTTTVRKRLERMSEILAIKVADIPRFLEDYGDTFLSLSYYRRCLDEIMPTIDIFITALKEIRNSYQLSKDRPLVETCTFMEKTINQLLATTVGSLENFDRSTNQLWQNLTAESFRKVESLITGYHTVIGGVLCALSVKMFAWRRLFPSKTAGGPLRRAEFVMTDMRQGMNRILQLENSSPLLATLDVLKSPPMPRAG